MTLASIVHVALVAALASQATPSPANVARAAALFGEAREAILSAPVAVPMDSAFRAELLLVLAKSESPWFPEAAADDAARAFDLARTLPGKGRELQPGLATQVEMVGWMTKMTLEPDALQVLVQLNQRARARSLARDGDVDCMDLYHVLILQAPLVEVPELVNECRAQGGNYPFRAILQRVRDVPPGSPASRALLEPAYAAAAAAVTFKERSLALSFIDQTWSCNFVSSAVAQQAIDGLLGQMIARPIDPTGGLVPDRTDRDLFGPEILELMMLLNPQRAAAIAADYPNWEAARKVPGTTSRNPVGLRPGSQLVRGCAAAPASTPSRSAPAAAGAMTAAEFDRAVDDARRLSPASPKMRRLVALAILLLTPPPNVAKP